MKKRKFSIELTKECKTGRINDACARYGVGIGTMRKIAEDAGAVVRIGRTYLINFTKVDAYMDMLSGEE